MGSSKEQPRGRKRDADATRAALLDAARELFGRHGYAAVTLRDIGERAGADGSLVARYFGGKAALYRSAVAEDGRESAASPGGVAPGAYTAEALRRADLRGTPGPLVQALLSQGSAPEVRASAAEEMRDRLVSPLAARLALGGADDPVAGAEVLVACLVGVISLRTSGLFDGLSRVDPEVVGAVLESAARAWPAVATYVPGTDASTGPAADGAGDGPNPSVDDGAP
ncbi:TetR/AcrR family transcriptional regulator [Streptomyces cinereoruber]|uniref:TetR/AcrR family transcriptional regulator n=1 Tax=Streptomyces cinereoruber TaxID=67260 RepID=UPI00363F7CC4